ncbi:hypothetical protein SRHO_G00297740 [Serrasalmus rhombeus]
MVLAKLTNEDLIMDLIQSAIDVTEEEVKKFKGMFWYCHASDASSDSISQTALGAHMTGDFIKHNKLNIVTE